MCRADIRPAATAALCQLLTQITTTITGDLMTHQPTAAENDLAARLAAADHAWSIEHDDAPSEPAYIRHLARHAAGLETHSNQITGSVTGTVIQAGDIRGGLNL